MLLRQGGSGEAGSIGPRVLRSCAVSHVLTWAAFLSLQAGTWGNARTYPGIYASWAVLLLLVLITLARALYWACMRVSQPLQNLT